MPILPPSLTNRLLYRHNVPYPRIFRHAFVYETNRSKKDRGVTGMHMDSKDILQELLDFHNNILDFSTIRF